MQQRVAPHIALAHAYWKSHLRLGDLAIDATCGNGHDTAVLAKLLLDHPESLIVGFDIQMQALQNTEALLKQSLKEEQLARVLFHRRCHSEIDAIPLPFPPKLIVYNLGYLPGADKSMTTRTDSTLASLERAAALVAEEGALSITCYPGHPEGKKEEEAILSWAQTLESSAWQACHHRWLNRNAAPSFLWLRRL